MTWVTHPHRFSWLATTSWKPLADTAGLGVLSKCLSPACLLSGLLTLRNTKAICDAFDGAWAFLTESQSPLASDSFAATTRELLAKRVIEMAERGLRDPAKLQADALSYLQSNPPKV